MNRETLTLPKHDRRIIGQKCERVFTFDRATADEDSRTVTAALSSTAPVERWWGIETLIHTKGAVNLERASPSLPLLFNHDPDQIVGSAEAVRLEGDKLRARLRFAQTDRGAEIWSLIRDGHLRGVSIGYSIDAIESAGERDGQPAYNVTRWTIYESSITPVPADHLVGIGRNIGAHAMKENEHTSRSEQRNEQHTNNPEYRRINGLLEAGDEFKAYGGQEVARELVKDPTATMETLRLRLADKLRAMKPTPFATAQPGDTGPSGNSVIPRAFGNARVLSAFGENRRAAEEAAYGVGQWLRAQLTGNAKAEAWCRDHGYAVRAAGGGVNSAGGFLVPIELSSAIVNLVEEYGVARQECRAVTMSSDVINVSVKKSGLTHYYVSENSEITKSDVTWGNLSLTARKLATLSVMSAEVAEDAVIDLASWLAMEAAQAFAEAEDNALFNGDGTSTYGGITGIRTKIIDGTHNAGKVTAGANIDTFAEITTGDLDSLVAALPAYALRGAKFYCSAAFYATVFQRFIEAAGGLTLADMVKGPITKGYMGLPIVTSPKMPASTSTDYSGEAMLLFGNMDQAVLFGSRREVRVKVDESRYLEFDQIAVQVTERYDVNAHGLGDNTTAGPMVGLIGN